MEITLTPDESAQIGAAVESGRIEQPEDALRLGLSLWLEQERERVELINAIQEGEADLEAGRFVEFDEEGLLAFIEEIKTKGRLQISKLTS